VGYLHIWIACSVALYQILLHKPMHIVPCILLYRASKGTIVSYLVAYFDRQKIRYKPTFLDWTWKWGHEDFLLSNLLFVAKFTLILYDAKFYWNFPWFYLDLDLKRILGMPKFIITTQIFTKTWVMLKQLWSITKSLSGTI